ncbi:hypothetical protein AMTR_s00207p00029640 [Amborella trichopoda]|uniref:Uncharacterized protein n=1 Tax=Amborella trichopoda TaxID=13333 RepID=W1P7Q3_AMBTC|nr:hypothetical protein AMTR_s00207p00029640 [Amborella trichopoda]
MRYAKLFEVDWFTSAGPFLGVIRLQVQRMPDTSIRSKSFLKSLDSFLQLLLSKKNQLQLLDGNQNPLSQWVSSIARRQRRKVTGTTKLPKDGAPAQQLSLVTKKREVEHHQVGRMPKK